MTTRGPLYTCLVRGVMKKGKENQISPKILEGIKCLDTVLMGRKSYEVIGEGRRPIIEISHFDILLNWVVVAELAVFFIL